MEALSNPNPLTPRTVSNPNPNPNPNTFIHADTSSFKQVVQMLTGSVQLQDAAPPQKNPIPPAPKRPPAFKLYERRRSFRHLTKISSRKRPGALSQSALELSPVTPLIHDPFNGGPPSSPSLSPEEERAIASKGYYFHPSPRCSPEPPRLLPLFPLTPCCSASSAHLPS